MLHDRVTVFALLHISFFFFKQKTAYEMRISDWSSDVCSSDLQPGAAVAIGFLTAIAQVWSRRSAVHVAMPPLSADPSRTQAGGVSACQAKRFQAAKLSASITSSATPSF